MLALAGEVALLLNYRAFGLDTRDGKTVTESLPDHAAARKAEREIAEFRKLQGLHKEFVEVNSQICHIRPSEPDALLPEEKNGRRDPSRNRARNRPTAAGGLPGSS